MREVVRFTVDEALPAPSRILRAQGLPEGEALPARLRGLLEEALSAYAALVSPRAVLEEVSGETFDSVYKGAEVEREESVVGLVYPRAEARALFVATGGERVGNGIRDLFRENELARAWMLDAVASVGTDYLGDRLAERYRTALAARGAPHVRVLPYSPGYCGWPTRGQGPLFEVLRPTEIGVSLNDSCLMSPLKSVSGVLLAGRGEIHRFRPDFPFCEECRGRECGPRLASVLDRHRAGGGGDRR